MLAALDAKQRVVCGRVDQRLDAPWKRLVPLVAVTEPTQSSVAPAEDLAVRRARQGVPHARGHLDDHRAPRRLRIQQPRR